MRTRVKICGLTRPDDVIFAVKAGADALGFVFYKRSPRYVSPETARELASGSCMGFDGWFVCQLWI